MTFAYSSSRLVSGGTGACGRPCAARHPVPDQAVLSDDNELHPQLPVNLTSFAYQSELAIGVVTAWRRTDPLDRAAVLATCADMFRSKADEGAVTLVRENGKTLAEARVEVTKTADFLDYYASFARQPWGEILADARGSTPTTVRYEPVGVVLAITPWNDPLLTPARKLGPALLAAAGLPDGVLDVVTGRERDISAALLGHPELEALTFTGSTAVGDQLRRALSDRNVRLQTETGGKNASVVLADADLDLAADTVAAAAFGQAGQRCTATSRLIVDQAVAPALLELLRRRVDACVLGPGLDPATTLGPLATADHRDGVLAHVDQARAQKADVLAGGVRPSAPALRYGCYVEAAIVSVSAAHSRWRDEVFWPVIAVCQARGFDEAVDLTNDSRYGLSAAVFTSDLRLASQFIDRVEAGQVAVNLPTSGWDVHHPFGGFRDSGSAFKEQGAAGLRFSIRIKTAAVRFAW